MIALYIVLGIAACVLLVVLVPISLCLAYDGELLVRLRVAGIPFTLYPRRKPKKTKKAKRKSQQGDGEKDKLSVLSEKLHEGGIPAVIAYIQETLSLVRHTISELLDAVIVDRLEVEVTVASGDAAETAMDYGKACAVLYPAVAALSARTRVQHRHIAVTPDFLAEQGGISADVHLHTQLWRLNRGLLRLIAESVSHTMKRNA